MPLALALPLALLVVVLVAAVGTAVYALAAARQRRELLLRFDGGVATAPTAPLLVPTTRTLADRLGQWIGERMPESVAEGAGADKLLHAGFEGRYALPLYTAVRAGVGLLVPALAFVVLAGRGDTLFLVYMALAAAVGFLGPAAVLDRLIQNRRDRIRRAIPDALDLLVVCVEAGVSLDAAIVRVSREVGGAHPDLAGELTIVNRKINAGVPREQALYGLWTRTGIEELRALAANMVQSDRWGTSIARVLRINAETLRRKRRQAAEKKAAEASLKMLGPLVLFLFPALFVVILGPAFINISSGLGGAFR